MSIPIDRELLPKKKAAVYLCVSVRTLERMAKENIGPPRVRIRSRWLYQRSALEAWIARGGAYQSATDSDIVRQ